MVFDTIDIVLERGVYDEQASNMFGEDVSKRSYHHINLVLNGTEVNGTFDPFAVIHAFNQFKQGNVDVLTCSCGNSGCAGIFHGTFIKHRRFTVEWRDIDCGLPKRFYSFKLADYTAAMEKGVELLKQAVSEREAIESPCWDGMLPDTVADVDERFVWTWGDIPAWMKWQMQERNVIFRDSGKLRKTLDRTPRVCSNSNRGATTLNKVCNTLTLKESK